MVGHLGSSPVRVLQVVAGPLQVPVPVGGAGLGGQVGRAVLGDDGLGGVDQSKAFCSSSRINLKLLNMHVI